MPTVAVTGASGFIGRRLVVALREAGYDVRALVRTAPPADAPRDIAWVKGDLADRDALTQLVAGVDAVVHGAGAVKALSRAAFDAVNVTGTATLADIAAARTTPPRFVHLSSFAARAPHLSAYAASKAAGEEAVIELAHRLPVSVLRPPAVYGPGDREALKVLQMASRGFIAVPPDRAARLSLVHVDDAADAVLAALKAPPNPIPVEFDDGKSGGHDWSEIAAAASRALRRPVRLLPIPALCLYGAGALATAAARLTRSPTVLSWDKIGEILHPDWVTATPPPGGYTPRWHLAPGFENTAEWAASRGLLRLLPRS